MYPEYHALGCRAYLVDPILQDALPIIRDCLQHQLYAAHMQAPDKFLATVMIAGTFIFTLDRERALGYIYRAPCLVDQIHPIFSREGGRIYVIKDLFEHLAGTEYDSIERGVFFLRYGCPHLQPQSR
jgi:hypothetical protein